MEKVFLIKFGEIFLKGKNRNFFEKVLLSNIKNSLKKYNAQVQRIPGRYLVSNVADGDFFEVSEILRKTPGIFSFAEAFCFDTSIEKMKEMSTMIMGDKTGTFKVVTNRADKTIEKNSMQISAELGGFILSKNNKLKVDIKNPDYILYLDVRENNKTFMYEKSVMGVGGMPVGTSGNGLLLLSGGIDSPVAGYMMAKRGVKISAVHFHSYPYTSNFAREKVEDLARLLTPYTGTIKIYMVSTTELQEAIHKNCNDAYMITLLRRGMFTIAERICKEKNIKMMITGESLGQVASQTIESMSVVSEVVKNTQIIRPLVAFDKCETIEIAKKINTFETSIKPYEDCCTVFLPENPIIKPKLEKVKFEQSKIDFSGIIDRAMQSVEIVEIEG